MTQTSPLTGSHLRTYNAIFQHPIAHNLEWRAVRSLLETLGHIAEEPNGNLKVTRNGQILVLHPPRTKNVAEADEIMDLRRFLEQSETAPPGANEKEAHWLLVIDHHEARIYRSEMRGSVPQQILPHEPEDYFRHAQDSKEFTKGQEKPDPNSFFEPVTRALQATGQILVFGTGTGTSSEMDQFIAWLKHHHPDVARRIIGSLVIDEHHLTEGQLLAKAREFYANTQASRS
ncbi:MAG: hypothetical protein WC378_02790 [Opitutaceae bacterium]|jgi:hypothetical protein